MRKTGLVSPAQVLVIGLVLVLLFGCLRSSAPPPEAAARVPALAAGPEVEAGRRWTAAFFEGRTGELWNHFEPPLRKLVKSKAGLDAFRQQVLAGLGESPRVLEERVDPAAAGFLYQRKVQASG